MCRGGTWDIDALRSSVFLRPDKVISGTFTLSLSLLFLIFDSFLVLSAEKSLKARISSSEVP